MGVCLHILLHCPIPAATVASQLLVKPSFFYSFFSSVDNHRCGDPFGKVSLPFMNHILGQIIRGCFLHMWTMRPLGSAANNFILRTNIYRVLSVGLLRTQGWLKAFPGDSSQPHKNKNLAALTWASTNHWSWVSCVDTQSPTQSFLMGFLVCKYILEGIQELAAFFYAWVLN